ncbi:MAG: hypothetical protein ABI409_11440 [Ramlibacter sp.]
MRKATVASVFALVFLTLMLLYAGSTKAMADTAESLARDPARLKSVLRECRGNAEASEDRRCRAAREAWRRHFFGERKTSRPQPSTSGKPDASAEPKPAPAKVGP